MSGRVWRMGVLALGFGFVASAMAADSVDDVTKKIKDATDKLKSFSAKNKMVTEMKQEGFSMVSTAEGITELMRKGEDLLMRTEMKIVSETEAGGTKNKQESNSLMISDGAFMYTLSEMSGQKSAFKSKTDKSALDPMKSWKESADLKVLPDEKVDGRETWVLEAVPKQGQGGPMGKSVLYFDKESGQMIKMVVSSPDGKPMTTTTCSDIKVNSTISADRFVFTAPPGVEVQESK